MTSEETKMRKEQNKKNLREAWEKRIPVYLTFRHTEQIKKGKKVFLIIGKRGFHLIPNSTQPLYIKTPGGKFKKLTPEKAEQFLR